MKVRHEILDIADPYDFLKQSAICPGCGCYVYKRACPEVRGHHYCGRCRGEAEKDKGWSMP